MGVSRINAMQSALSTQPAQSVDTESKSIKNEITGIQRQMQKVSADESLSVEEKTKRRQELQQEISSLNTKLRQHEAEKKKEQQAANRKEESQADSRSGESREESLAPKRVNENQATEKAAGLSTNGMTAFVSADSSIEQARRQDGVVSRIEGSIGVLRAEIKQDAGRGANVEKKHEELEGLEERAQRASGARSAIMGAANQNMKEVAKAEQSKATDKKASPNLSTVDGKDIGGFVKEKTAADSKMHLSVDVRG